MEALILVATLVGPTMFARIGIMGRPEAEEAHRMKLTRRFAELTSEKRPQAPRMGRPARPNLNRRQEFPLQRTREMAMPQANPTATANRANWPVGQRVSRKNTREL